MFKWNFTCFICSHFLLPSQQALFRGVWLLLLLYFLLHPFPSDIYIVLYTLIRLCSRFLFSGLKSPRSLSLSSYHRYKQNSQAFIALYPIRRLTALYPISRAKAPACPDCCWGCNSHILHRQD